MSQNKNKILRNTFSGGMDLDSYPSFIPDGAVRYRLNGEDTTDFSVNTFDSNARGNSEFVDLPKDVVASILVKERDWAVVFSKDGGKDTIGYIDFKEKTYKEVMNAQEFKCAWNFHDCELISVDYDYISGCNELKVYFSSNWTYYHVNIDEMLDADRKTTLKNLLLNNEQDGLNRDPLHQCGVSTCDYFKVFTCSCGVKTVAVKSEHGGYNLQAGVYQIAVQLIDGNGAKTNVFQATEPINIGSENNIPGERSEEYISVQLDNLDCRYHIIRIFVIKTIGGVTTASIVADKHFTNNAVSFEYYGTNDEEVPVPLSEVRVQSRTFIEGKDIFIHNSRAWYYNLKPNVNPNIQRKVIEQTKVGFSVFQVPYEDTLKFDYKSLMRSERYLFGISYNVCGKGQTPVFVLSPQSGAPANSAMAGIVNDNEDKVTLTYTAQEVLRTRGASSGGSSGGGCSGGQCPEGIDLRGQGTEEEENSSEQQVSDVIADLINVIENLNTKFSDICNVLDCEPHTCNQDEPPDCVGCETECCDSPCDECECEYRHKGAVICSEEYPDIEKGFISMTKWLAGLTIDDTNYPLNAASLKEAALDLVENGVVNKEVKTSKSSTTGYTTDSGSEFTDKVEPLAGTTEGNANNVNAKGNKLVNDNAVKVATGQFIPYQTTELYPDTFDCDGEYLYGALAGQPIKLFEVPGADVIPLVKSQTTGVKSPAWGVDEWANTYMNLIGLNITDIYIPTEEELGGTLCEDNPYTIVMAERTWANSRVIAKGVTFGTFEGIVNGRRYAYPKHGVNSPEVVDRYINNGEEFYKRMGMMSDNPRFTFHSADTNVYHMGLAVSHVKDELNLYGTGFRYGLYAKGEDPQNTIYGKRIDMRGCRSASNLNQSTPAQGELNEVTGITYAKGNKIVTNPKGIDLPLMNRGRESSVYLQILRPQGLLNFVDHSFLGDVWEHSVPILKNKAQYVALIREIPNQYGGLVNQAYISTGLIGTPVYVNGEKTVPTSISGICGDVYIGYNTVKRTSYISDMVGGKFNIPAWSPNKKEWRSVCDTPEDAVENTVGLYYPTKFPLAGDKADAKNWAGLHTRVGLTDPPLTRQEVEARADSWILVDQDSLTSQFTESPYYYPRTLTHLVHFWGESRVNPYYLQTGAGDQRVTKDVYYPKLKGLPLDSAVDSSDIEKGKDWTECYLNNYREEVVQPSRAQLLKKALIKTIIEYLLPGLDALAISFLENPESIAAFSGIQPILIGVWLFFKDNLLSEKKINELLGIPNCYTDEEGAMDDSNILGYKDNYYKYNSDYSTPNRVNIYRGLPDPYYTCDCSDIVNGQTSDEIKYSDVKVLGSLIDNYLKVSPLNTVIVPSKLGKLKKLFVEGGSFYGHTDKQIIKLEQGNVMIPTQQGVNVSLGGGGLLDIPQGLWKTIPEGFVGLKDPNASHSTPFGQVFVDADARAIYIWNNGKAENISNYGLSRFFWEKLPFNCDDCRDENEGSKYLFGVDYESKILYFSKVDCECSFTVSFSLAKKQWRSFFSFIPDWYIWTRDKMFSAKNDKLWQHGVGDMQTYYGTYYPYVLEFITREKDQSPIEYKSTILDTVAYLDGNIDVMENFNKVALYTMTQSSGEQDLTLITNLENAIDLVTEQRYVPLKRDGRLFKFNDIKNRAKFGDKILTESCVIPIINDVYDAGEYENQIYDDYIITRLTLNKPDKNINLITKSVSTLCENRMDS